MYFKPSLTRLQTLTLNLLQALAKSAPTSPTKFAFLLATNDLPFLVCMCVCQTAASAKELEQYYSEAQIWLELLEEEAKQGENLKEEDFQEDKVSHKHVQQN